MARRYSNHTLESHLSLKGTKLYTTVECRYPLVICRYSTLTMKTLLPLSLKLKSLEPGTNIFLLKTACFSSIAFTLNVNK